MAMRVVSAVNQFTHLLMVNGVKSVIALGVVEVFCGLLANVVAVSVLVQVNKPGMLYQYRISMISYCTFSLHKAYGKNTNPQQ